jgi:hypothetical protein
MPPLLIHRGSTLCFSADSQLFPMLRYAAWRQVLRARGGRLVCLHFTPRHWMQVSALLSTLDDLRRSCMGDWMQVSGLLNTLDGLRRSCMGDWMQVSALLNTLDDLRRSCMGDWMQVSGLLNTLDDL